MNQAEIFDDVYQMILSWDNDSGCRGFRADRGSLCSYLDDRGGHHPNLL